MRKILFLMLAGFVFKQLARRNPKLARYAPFVDTFTSGRRKAWPR